MKAKKKQPVEVVGLSRTKVESAWRKYVRAPSNSNKDHLTELIWPLMVYYSKLGARISKIEPEDMLSRMSLRYVYILNRKVYPKSKTSEDFYSYLKTRMFYTIYDVIRTVSCESARTQKAREIFAAQHGITLTPDTPISSEENALQ